MSGAGYVCSNLCPSFGERRLWTQRIIDEYELGVRASMALRAENRGRMFETRRAITNRCEHAERRASA